MVAWGFLLLVGGGNLWATGGVHGTIDLTKSNDSEDDDEEDDDIDLTGEVVLSEEYRLKGDISRYLNQKDGDVILKNRGLVVFYKKLAKVYLDQKRYTEAAGQLNLGYELGARGGEA